MISPDVQGRFYGGARGPPPNEKCGPHFGPASLDFHLNRPVIYLIQLQNTVISLIQLHIVAPRPQVELWPPIAPHLASARTAPEF